MGKSEGNAVFLDQEPRDIYGRVMSWTDGVIPVAFELCTNVSMDEVKKINQQLAGGQVNPRDLKMKLAFELTKIIHGEKQAQEAQEYFVKTFQKKEIPSDIKKKVFAEEEANIIDLLVWAGLAQSKSEAKRLVSQGGIKVDGKTISDINQNIKIEKGILLQRGKRHFVRIVKSK